jgi:hypothetical protein
MPHPLGNIVINMETHGAKGEVQIDLPRGLTGDFSWKGHQFALKEGKQEFSW